MDASKATPSAATPEITLPVAGASQATVNQRNTTHPPPGETNLNIEITPHPDLTIPPPGTRIVQTPQFRVPTHFPVEQLEILHNFNILEMNLGAQDANELLNGIYNIVEQQNSKEMEERFLCLEESIHDTQP